MKWLDQARHTWRRFAGWLWAEPGFRLLAYLALGIWALAADPFTLSSSSDKALSREYHNLYVRLEGVEPPPLTVVMLDAASIRDLHNDGQGWMTSDDWPLNYQDHARLIKDLTVRQAHPPSVLFYDIYFEVPREASGDLGRLGRQIQQIHTSEGGVPILLAGGGDPMPMTATAYAQLQQPRLTPISWQGFGDRYPLWAPIAIQGQAETPGPRPTPASAIYHQLCDAYGRHCDWLSDQKAPAVAVHWSVLAADSCIPDAVAPHARLVAERATSGILQGLTSRSAPAPIPATCLPVHHVQASQLYGPEPASLVPPGVGKGDPYAVMVGVVMPSTHDYIPTPVYEQIAGVFLHAMAFENLWRLEGGYFHYRNLTPWGIAAWGVAALLFMLQARYRYFHPPRRKVPLVLVWWGVIAAVVILLQLIFHNLMRIVPEGWLSLMAVVPLLREVVLRNEAAINQKQGKTE